jgi:hypothetical protein
MIKQSRDVSDETGDISYLLSSPASNFFLRFPPSPNKKDGNPFLMTLVGGFGFGKL